MIPQTKLDYLNQLSQIHGIPEKDLVSYYEKHLNDPAYTQMFSNNGQKNDNALMDYIDALIIGFVQEFHAQVLEEFELFIIASPLPRISKAGNLFNAHIGLAKRPHEQKPKWINVINLEESGIPERLNPLSTGTMKLSISEEDDQHINAFSRSSSQFNQRNLTWIPHTEQEKKDYLRKVVRQVEINQAGKNLSAIDSDKRTIPYSLRLINGTISSVRRGKKIDDETKKEREYAIVSIIDKSVALNFEFFKNKTMPDPKDHNKTKIIYGGFSGFVEPDDVRNMDKGSTGEFIGHITAPNQMNILTILPAIIVAPKKPTERLQKTGQQPQKSFGVDPAAI